MDRLIAPNTVPFGSHDVAPAAGTPGLATDGNAATGVPPTDWPAYAWNMLSEEFRNAIIDAGLTPDKNNWTQLSQAIRKVSNLGFTPVRQGTSDTVNIGWDAPASDLNVQINGASVGNIAFREWVAANYQQLLNFTPVQQGGGTGQFNNKLFFGYNGKDVLVQVDNNSADFGALALAKNVLPTSGGIVSGDLGVQGSLTTNRKSDGSSLGRDGNGVPLLSRLVTASEFSLHQSQVTGASGFVATFPNGYTIQMFGITIQANTNSQLTLPIAFPTTFIGATGSVNYNGANLAYIQVSPLPNNLGSFQATITAGTSGSYNATIIAIGY